MGVASDSVTDCCLHNQIRSDFLQDLGFNFKIGLMKSGSLSNWVVVWRMGQNDDQNNQRFQGFIVEVLQQIPTMLFCCETKDAIDCIAFACNTNTMKSKALLDAILPQNVMPSFSSVVINESRSFSKATKVVLSSENKEELDILTDMCQLNCRGNLRTNLMDLYWEYAIHVLELENSADTHSCHHASHDTSSTVNIAYTLGILLTFN